MNIYQAAKKKIKYLRLPQWNDKAYIELELMGNCRVGPWVRLYDPYSTETPIDLLVSQVLSEDYVEFIK